MRALIPLVLFAAGCSCPRPAAGPRLHYEAIGPLRNGVIIGDLAHAAHQATLLDGGDVVRDFGAEGIQDEATLHAAAGFVMVAADPLEAGEGVAAIGRACGDCHTRVGPSPIGSAGMALRALGDQPMHQRHNRVADTLWWSLVGPEPSTAEAALELVAAALIVAPASPGSPLAAEIQQAAMQARGGPLDRAQEVYGVMMASCAECHALANPE